MPKVQRVVKRIVRALCSCTRDQNTCYLHSSPYRQLNPPNKQGVPIIEKAEMLDPEDRAWV